MEIDKRRVNIKRNCNLFILCDDLQLTIYNTNYNICIVINMYIILTAKRYWKQHYARFEFCIMIRLMIIDENLHFIFHCHDIYIYIHIYITMYSLLIYVMMYMMYYSIVTVHTYAVDINLQTSGELANAKLYCCTHYGETGINVFSFYDFWENRIKLL